MKFYVIWRTSLKAILKNKRRSALTMVGIIIGIAAVITIMSLGRGYEKDTIKKLTNSDSKDISVDITLQPDDVNLDLNTTISYFKPEDVANVEQIEGVKLASIPPKNTSNLTIDIPVNGKKKSKRIRLIEEQSFTAIAGRPVSEEDSLRHNKVVAVDHILAKDLYGSEENALGNGVNISGELFTIVGVFSAPGEDVTYSEKPNIVVPKLSYYDYFEEKHAGNWLRIVIEEDAKKDVVSANVIKELTVTGTMRDLGVYKDVNNSALSKDIGEVLTSLTLFISAIAGISLFIAGVGVMNMMYISVSERTKEIGIRRSLGATAKDIRTQFLLEGVTLTVLGGLIGYLFGLGISAIISTFLPFSISVDFFTFALAFSVSTLIGIAFSVMPASVAAKKDLIDILR